jgi:hypothetical protein
MVDEFSEQQYRERITDIGIENYCRHRPEKRFSDHLSNPGAIDYRRQSWRRAGPAGVTARCRLSNLVIAIHSSPGSAFSGRRAAPEARRHGKSLVLSVAARLMLQISTGA